MRSVLTRAHQIRVSTRELAVRVERLVPGSLCQTIIPEDARVVDSPDVGLPVTLLHPRCRASLAYRELVEELYPLLVRRDLPSADPEAEPETVATAPAMASPYGD